MVILISSLIILYTAFWVWIYFQAKNAATAED